MPKKTVKVKIHQPTRQATIYFSHGKKFNLDAFCTHIETYMAELRSSGQVRAWKYILEALDQ